MLDQEELIAQTTVGVASKFFAEVYSEVYDHYEEMSKLDMLKLLKDTFEKITGKELSKKDA